MEVSMYGMERQITSGTLTIRCTMMTTVAAVRGWASLAMSVTVTGLTHRTVMVRSRTVAP